jgi:hypothetical protein
MAVPTTWKSSFLSTTIGLMDIHVSLHTWATGHGLQRTAAEYFSATGARRELRFLRDGHPAEEAAWGARWLSSDLDHVGREIPRARVRPAVDRIVSAWA